ncbi:MAG: alpha-amylase family glycosyl hydrolase, partial [Carnobacterium jeotgali]|uniref:alpha-amylase family glycosyl hydrolase n=1 Tax=Carnobacterium jeotgali TaxID=545534 RepID=UPI003C74ABAC
NKMVAGLNEQLMLYRNQTNEVMFNVLDSHDTARLLTVSKDNKQLAKAGLAFMFTQHGSPCIYYGTEIGMDGFNDPDCRKCMIWDEEKQDSNMLSFTKELIAFRKTNQELLSYGEVEWFDVRDDEKVIGFKKKFGDEEFICYFNQGEEDLELSLDQIPEVLFWNLAFLDNKLLSVKQNGFAIYKVE